MQDKIEGKRLKILRILNEAGKPLSGQVIRERLEAQGIIISERTVRFHLLAMDKGGLTEYVERKGRRLTAAGKMELSKVKVIDKVGFLSAKIDNFSYKMQFDLDKKQGNVLLNITLIHKEDLSAAVELIIRAFEAGITMGELTALYYPGDKIGDVAVPEGFVGIGSVCSISLNGILLSEGVPVVSDFGGLLEVEDHMPKRFVEVIRYNGTSVDPLEIFISSGMTNYTGAVSGCGLVGASFRLFPASARDRVIEISHRCKEIGLGAFLEVGWPGQNLLDIPVCEGRAGFIVAGGLNAVGILAESGIQIYSKALSGFADFSSLIHYKELRNYIGK